MELKVVNTFKLYRTIHLRNSSIKDITISIKFLHRMNYELKLTLNLS